jgi:thiamine-phosphate pyrophosphorylase
VRQCLRAQAEFAVGAGIDAVQIRERDLAADDLCALVVELVAIARGSRTRILINDRADVALACGADGVHLRADSVPPEYLRSIAPPGFVIGQSVHQVSEAQAAAAHVDYLIAGTVWPTPSKTPEQPTLGVPGLAAIVQSVDVPVLAIGGVTADRLVEVQSAGAAGAAAIGLFLGPVAPSHCRAASLRELAVLASGLAPR